jgi:hypothetical protein
MLIEEAQAYDAPQNMLRSLAVIPSARFHPSQLVYMTSGLSKHSMNKSTVSTTCLGSVILQLQHDDNDIVLPSADGRIRNCSSCTHAPSQRYHVGCHEADMPTSRVVM